MSSLVFILNLLVLSFRTLVKATVLTDCAIRFEMSYVERGLTVVKDAHSRHEKVFENTVRQSGKRTPYCHRNKPGSVC